MKSKRLEAVQIRSLTVVAKATVDAGTDEEADNMITKMITHNPITVSSGDLTLDLEIVHSDVVEGYAREVSAEGTGVDA